MLLVPAAIDQGHRLGWLGSTEKVRASPPTAHQPSSLPVAAVSERVVRYIKLQADILNCTYSYTGDRVPNINFYEFTLQVRSVHSGS